ncbi:MAG: hypothetical protein HFJ34_01175 [Clostridia bacterium]|nr:hypothetical protein [Clostridia bacterium]
MNQLDKKLRSIFEEEREVPKQFSKAIKETMQEQQKIKNKGKYKKWLNVAAVLLIVVLLGTATTNIYAQIKWNIEYKEFENRPIEYGSASIKKAIEEGNEKNIEMDYIYHDNIGVRLDSLFMTDDFFSMNVDFIFPKETPINTDTFTYGYAIYDEQKNVYGIYEGALGEIMNQNYWKKLYKEEGIEYNPKDMFPSRPLADNLTGAMVTTSKEGNVIAQVTMQTPREFPKSKKLYIRIFNIGYTMTEYEQKENRYEIVMEEKFKLTQAEWKLEVEVPESFYQRQTVTLKLAKDIQGFELKKLNVTETGTNIIFKMDGFLDLVMAGMGMPQEEFEQKMEETIYIVDENGKRYGYLQNSNGTYFDNSYKAKFDITKNDLNQRFYLCVKINGVESCSELVKK